MEKYNIHRSQMHFEIQIQFQFNSFHYLLNFFQLHRFTVYSNTCVELISEAFSVKEHHRLTSHHRHQQHNLYPLILQTASNTALQSRVSSFLHLTLLAPKSCWHLRASLVLLLTHTHKPLHLCRKWLSPLTGFVSHSSEYYHVLPAKGKRVMRAKREGKGPI